MSPNARKVVLWLLLLAAFAFRVQFIAHGIRDLALRGPLYDDSFYAFEIARNIAAGHGSTFDGLHPTNGYQPLYVLLLVPLYWVFGGHPIAPIYVALVGSALLNVLTGWILFRLVRRYASDAAAFFALVLWSFGPAIVRQSVNGLETSLAMFLLAACLDVYLNLFRARGSERRAAVTLGALLGLAVLARVDAVLFAMALVADVLWRTRGREMRRLGVALGIAGLMALPWCVASRVAVGSVLPQSGAATRLLSEAYAAHDHPNFGAVSPASGPSARFVAGNLLLSLLQLGTSPVLHVYTRGLERLIVPARVDSTAGLYGFAIMLLLAVLAAVYATWRRARRGRSGVPADFAFLFLYSLLLVVAYSCVVFGQIFYSRYYYPIFFFSVLIGAFAVDMLLEIVPAGRRRRLLAGTIIAAYALILPYMALHRVQNGNYRFLRVADWIGTHTPPGSTVGVFNSGAIGYFSDRHIVNLDGKVNPLALEALRRDALRDYVRAEHIDYVIDHEWIVSRFLLTPGASDGLHFARVEDDTDLGVPGWGAYRVERIPIVGAAGGPAMASRLHP
jgi:hypothetical protein